MTHGSYKRAVLYRDEDLGALIVLLIEAIFLSYYLARGQLVKCLVLMIYYIIVNYYCLYER